MPSSRHGRRRSDFSEYPLLLLDEAFNAVARERNAQSRGWQFELLINRLLTESGFDPLLNPRSARPRQTDIFASHDGDDFLIEAKWVGHKIGSPEVDALRSRLGRTPAHVIGCILSMSEYAASAISEVESRREREILLF